MIRNPEVWRRWEAQWQRRTPAVPEENFRIFQNLLELARLLGRWPPEDPREGLEVDLLLARAVNGYVRKPAG